MEEKTAIIKVFIIQQKWLGPRSNPIQPGSALVE